MDIDVILSLLPVPNDCIETEGHDWSLIQKKFGIEVPSIYSKFLATYGTGSIGGFLWVLNPFSKNENLNISQVTYHQEAYRFMKDEFPSDYQRKELPLPGSFYTWAVTDNGDSVFWVIDVCNANDWEVGIHSSDQGEEELTGMVTADFLELMLKNQLNSEILPADFLSMKKAFNPA